jgi:RNA polymerase sigma-70 factor (ECF subfamily)
VQPQADAHLLELLRQPATRDRGFQVLVDTYGERLYRHIRRLVIRHEDADDVLQNTLIKVFRGIDSFQSASRLYTWLYRIATNEALTFLDRRRRRQALSLEDESSWVAAQLQADPHFDGNAAQRLLHAAIATLPDKQRVVFNLRYFEEMSYRDMSELLGTSEGALKANFHHATKKVEHYVKQTQS